MTDHTPDGHDRQTSDAEKALKKLIRSARANGLDPRGSWMSRALDGQANFGIQIFELAD